jgi:hypothetical protein
MAANGISTLMIASGTTLTKNVSPPHTNTEIVAPFSAIWSLNYVGALGATNDVSYKLYVTSLGIGSAVTLTSHQTGDYAVTAGNFLYDEYGTSIGIIKGNTTIDNYMAKAAAVCGSLSNTIITAATYKGTWNAFSNTPTLTNGVGTLGDAYSVTTSGTSGAYPVYGEQDWRIYNGATWVKVDHTITTEWTLTPATGGLADKEARQIAKLDIAQAKRQGKVVATDGTISGAIDTTKPYYRANNTYSLTLLPDTYATNADDNANTSGLLQGRPWYDPNTEAFYDGEVLEVSPGIWRTNYQNYYFEDGNFFDTAALKTGGAAYNGPTSDISIPDLPEYTSIMLKGYMKVTYTGTYTFYLDCDDGAYMWFGDNAITNWKDQEGNLINYDINNGGEHGQQEISGTVNLTAGNYIPLRVAFGNNGGPGILIVSYSHTGQAKTSDFAGKIFYRTATNGF